MAFIWVSQNAVFFNPFECEINIKEARILSLDVEAFEIFDF